MKYSNGLSFDETFNIRSLRDSDERIRKNVKNRKDIERWDKHKDKNQKKLLRQIREGRYKVSPYHDVDVMLEKPRTLSILPHKDRIFQDMLLKSMKTHFDRVFIEHSYACIVGRGTTKCIKDIQRILINDEFNTKYFIQLDILKYFPNINGDILKKIIRKTISDERLLYYHDILIDSYIGLPIGNSTSQYYANLFISYILHKLLSLFNKFKIYVFVYMDDILILCSDKRYLIEIRDFIIAELDLIKLKLKYPNMQVYVVRKNGIRFLGFILYGTHTLIRKNVIIKCWKLVRRYCDGKIDKESFKKSYTTYSGMFKLANTRGLCFKLYEYIYEHTGEKFYFNNWNGEVVKISKMYNKNVRIIDITSFNRTFRIDFMYCGKPYRILTKSNRLVKTLLDLRKIHGEFDFVL